MRTELIHPLPRLADDLGGLAQYQRQNLVARGHLGQVHVRFQADLFELPHALAPAACCRGTRRPCWDRLPIRGRSGRARPAATRRMQSRVRCTRFVANSLSSIFLANVLGVVRLEDSRPGRPARFAKSSRMSCARGNKTYCSAPKRLAGREHALISGAGGRQCVHSAADIPIWPRRPQGGPGRAKLSGLGSSHWPAASGRPPVLRRHERLPRWTGRRPTAASFFEPVFGARIGV